MVLYHLKGPPPIDRFYSPGIANLQFEKHVICMHKTQPVPAGYVVNKVGLGGAFKQFFNRVLVSGDLKNETGRVFLGRMHYISPQKLPGEPKNSYF